MQNPTAPLNIRMGIISGIAVAILSILYAIVLSIGLLTLPSPDLPIRNPWFTVMEVLILLIAPAMVVFTVGLHSWALADRKSLSLLSVTFMSMCAIVTCCVHFAVLTLSRELIFTEGTWSRLVFDFQWPSVVYAMDILAWDIFFPLAALSAAGAVHGAGLAGVARNLLLASAALAFIGLAGVPVASMNIRNIGIIGYVVLFPIATVMLSIVLKRDAARGAG
ncbi:MAG: hypothetical protein IPG23_16210 [Burkholderiales bacterium]|jgi:hypothetical protein|nr:hypothetical protein [Burkholderiales bacterium]